MVARQIQPHHQPEPQRKQRKVVRHRAKITLGEKLIALMMAGILFGLFGWIVHNFATIYSLQSDIATLETSVETQQDLNAGYEIQVKELSAPDRIMTEAEKMGMQHDNAQVKVSP
ncbi:cell division protein FtsL [Shouchella shacheensis]|uniref:cell division protein FtsL n=1 Tax=Shouchella shacheensis TaxID=1649580 RepID=UPI0007401B2F|nr:septum formation initiator family protein [Shouchella shacheensis]